MIKRILALCLSLLSTQSFGQVIFDTIPQTGSNSITRRFPGMDPKTGDIYVNQRNSNTGEYLLLRFDNNLNLIDTLFGEDAGRSNVRFTNPITFNKSLYYLCVGNDSAAARDFSYHKISNGVFRDSIGFNLDTLPYYSNPYIAREIDNNTLQLLVNVTPPAVPSRTYSRIYHLDSNFQVKSYHNPNFDSLTNTFARTILAVHQLNDSTWHLYLSGALVVYNPSKRKISEHKKILFEGFDTYPLPNKKHLALGVTSYPIKPPLGPSNSPSSLGFYIVDSNASIIDTIQFNAFKDTVPALWINNYSSERVASADVNSIIYDTNNIFLACDGSYTEFNGTTFRQYFYVVKTGLSHSSKWQFIWGGENNIVNFTGITPTMDKGCVISGSIRRPNQVRHGVLIKLGPDGKISNVEVDAPENLVAFYPNPIKEKLHFDYLPQAKGQYTLEVMDMNGKPVLETSLDEQKGFIPVQLKTGFYIYQLKDEAGKVMQVGKLMAE